VFKALADGSRRQLLDSLNERNGQTLGELCADLSMTRQSVSKHLAVLEAANLVGVVWRGREKLHYLNPIPINEISQRWISRYDRHRVDALSDLKRALEAPAMDKPAFVYITYIATTPERLWEALTDPAFTRRWWDTTLHTDWQPGSTMTWETRGITVVLAHLHARTGPGQWAQRRGAGHRLGRAAVEGLLRAGADRPDGQADGGARRLRTREHGGDHGQPGVAAALVEYQVNARGRRAPARDDVLGLPEGPGTLGLSIEQPQIPIRPTHEQVSGVVLAPPASSMQSGGPER
jgi:DNA-binding transcriptional ArsR family regulator